MLRVCRPLCATAHHSASTALNGAATGLRASGRSRNVTVTNTLRRTRIGTRVMQTAAGQSKTIPTSTTLLTPSSSSPVLELENEHTTMAGTSSCQKRGHAGHHHHHDSTYLVSKDKTDPGVRITRIGLWSNLGMAAGKGVGGYMFNSQAMMADAIHSATDLASDILTLLTVTWSLKPPTSLFPLGFGKVESLGSLGVSGMLLLGGMWMCYGSSIALYAHLFADPNYIHDLLSHAHTHSHSHGPSIHAAWLAGGTVVIKEWLYQKTMKVAKERKSSVLASNAIHHRVDSLTGIVTLAAIVGANVMSNAAWLDPVGGFLISLMVIKAGWGNTLSAFGELADKGIDTEMRTSIDKAAKSSIIECLASMGLGEGHAELRDVQGTKSGQNFLIDLEVAVPAAWTVAETRKLEDCIRGKVGAKVRGVRRVHIRFIGIENDQTNLFDEFIPREVSEKAVLETVEEHEHQHEHVHDHAHSDATGEVKKKL